MENQAAAIAAVIAADNYENALGLNNLIPAAVDLAFPIQNNGLFNLRGEKPPRNERYFEETVPLYAPSTFKSHFRMAPQTMEVLIQEVGQVILQEEFRVSLEKKVLFSVWLMSHPETYLAAGDRFDLAESTSHFIFSQVLEAISGMMNNHITWPTPARQQATSRIFEARSHGFPGIIGAMDSTHFNIKQPAGNANDFYDRNRNHSINLFAVCDEDCRFVNIATGFPGRLHDARVFKNTPLGEALSDDHLHLIPSENHHIIADCAYPLLPYVMTPFQDNGHLNQRQVNYNRKLSSVRSVIERAFGRLKGKFRKLNLLEQTDLHLINHIISASCVIHNIIIDNEGLSDNEYSDDEEENNELAINQNHAVNRVGHLKRNHITAILP